MAVSYPVEQVSGLYKSNNNNNIHNNNNYYNYIVNLTDKFSLGPGFEPSITDRWH